MRDKNGKIIGWSLSGKGADTGKRINETLDWGRNNGLDPFAPEWAVKAVAVGAVGAITFSEVLEILGAGILIF